MRRWLVLAVVLTALGGVSPPSAAQLVDTERVLLRPRLELARVDFKELLPGSAARSLGAARPGRLPAADGIWGGVLVRELPSVWELRLAAGTRPSDLDVRYELTSLDGQPDRLGHVSDPGSTLAVSLVPREPQVLASERGGVLVRGGLTLELEVDSVRSAGSYRGTLTVTVNQL